MILLCSRLFETLRRKRTSSPRGNSKIVTQAHINVTAYDLDVELARLEGCSRSIKIVCSTKNLLHDLSSDRRKSDWFLSEK
jgi:hypothetical protein